MEVPAVAAPETEAPYPFILTGGGKAYDNLGNLIASTESTTDATSLTEIAGETNTDPSLKLTLISFLNQIIVEQSVEKHGSLEQAIRMNNLAIKRDEHLTNGGSKSEETRSKATRRLALNQIIGNVLSATLQTNS